MILKIRFGKWKFMFSYSQIEDIVGVNSKVGKDKHIRMWDLDNHPIKNVCAELRIMQKRFNLPNIYVVRTKKSESYHCYCLHKTSFMDACMVLSTTFMIDPIYYRLGVTRGYWTLRISPKSNRDIVLVDVLKSDVPEDVSVKDLKSFVIYETLPDTARRKKIEIGRN